LSLIDPVLEETGSGNIACVIAKAVYGEHSHDQSLIILPKLTQHIGRVNVIGVIIWDSLESCDVSDRPDRRSTDLPHPFGYVICDRKNLIRMLIEKQVIVAKMRSAHMPVKVLCLHIKGKHVREQRIETS